MKYEAMIVTEKLEDALADEMATEPMETLRGIMYYLRVHYPDQDILNMQNRQMVEDLPVTLVEEGR